MKCNKKKENVDLMLDEVDKPIDKALFIVSNVYYCIRYFYRENIINPDRKEYQNYLSSFKNKFQKKTISTKFTFNLLNKSSFFDESIDNDSDKNMDNSSQRGKTKEEIYYDLLYKRLINIINEEVYYNKEEYIKSIISLRNCFMFLEYLYLALKENPDIISHYIIKIDISLLLDIIQRTSKRLTNSDEFFYLNLIELKGLFPEIKYTTSFFIKEFDETLRIKYKEKAIPLKNGKLIKLNMKISDILNSLGKFNNNKISSLYDEFYQIQEDLKKNLIFSNENLDDLIIKYISDKNKLEKKRLSQIIEEANDDSKIILNCNYLYLIALDNFNELQEKDGNKKSIISNVENKINTNLINKDKNTVTNNNNFKDEMKNENEKLISTKDKDEKVIKSSINIKEKEEVNDILMKEKENLIKSEDLIIKIRSIKENILGLKLEEVNEYKDKYEEYIYRTFTYNRVLNLKNDNIYNILIFDEIIKQKEEKDINNIDDAYIKYKNDFISSIEEINSIDYKMFYDIISDKNFYDEIISILRSKPISEYLTKNRDYEEVKDNDANAKKKSYEFKFAEKGEPYVENFTNEYYKLMDKLSDNLFFINLFRLKYLPFGIKAFVNYNLKIIVNSLYYKFNKDINENNKKIIFKAALKILIIHEIMHILKYLKNEANFDEMPKTPRNREAGKMLINYLFGRPTIKSINLDEAEKINDCNNWKDITKLNKIFPNDNEQVEKKSINKNEDCLDLYFTEDDIEEENIKKIKVYEDIGIDID